MPRAVFYCFKHICNKVDLILESNRFYTSPKKRPKKTDFMQIIIDFVDTLPPLLQLLLGIFITVAIFRILMAIVDFIEDKREGK